MLEVNGKKKDEKQQIFHDQRNNVNIYFYMFYLMRFC